MRIAFITTMDSAPWGGSEDLWFKTALKANSKGHEILACVHKWANIPKQVDILQNQNIEIIKFELRKFHSKWYKRIFQKLFEKNYLQNYKKQLENVIHFNPDIICVSQGSTFNISQNEILYNYLINTKKKFVIICQHNNEFGGNFDDVQAEFEKKLFIKAQKVLFISKRNLETAQRQLACQIENASIISNPVNLAKLGIKSLEKSDNELSMACVARLETATKGQDILIQVLSLEVWRKRNFKLTLYGSGDDLNYLERLIKYHKLEKKIYLYGYIENIEIIWENNQILVLPSISEGTPLSMVEAMLCGRPVLGTDVGGTKEYIIENKTGFLSPFGSVEALASAMEIMWDNRFNLAEMGANAYAHALRITNMKPEESLIETLINCYNERNY